ncbi:MAG: hypothetical protein K8F92_19580 [Hyphomicrobium sp.]|uniref:hypothetical protein n=1 Tax=Hyphomicrobium sp. TaxID=82 RepID=UPI00132639E9|nr:hypothetical protein [Hyphomicrobium sp.]KAB2943892.1 MAG: hypothetical protein F9K20_00240 [Hyphomicrobium sp.]MBZ0211835.1 hypothetical protein [Hyphomicrobium sp.]
MPDWDSTSAEGVMAANVEAVIAALRVALEEAQKSEERFWKVEAANRWIAQLPGSWTGRWRKLVLGGNSSGDVSREEFVAHVRAVLAFLDANRAQIPASRKWWSPRRRSPAAQPSVQATAAPPSHSPARPVNLLRVRKPMPGVH